MQILLLKSDTENARNFLMVIMEYIIDGERGGLETSKIPFDLHLV